jgi:hypothetical protein
MERDSLGKRLNNQQSPVTSRRISTAAAEGKKRRVLIVSFVFPPLNDIGAVRIGKFAKYLPQFGWEPIVLTVNEVKGEPQGLPVETDEANVFRTASFELGSFIGQKLTTGKEVCPELHASRKNVNWRKAVLNALRLMEPIYSLPLISRLLSDPVGWYPHAVEKGLEIIASNDVSAIFSSSNPPLAHLIASRLHKRTGIPWVAEFRDAWTLNHYAKKTQPFYFFEQQVEKRTINNSSLLITASEPMTREMEALHSKEGITITNGFDEEDYMENVPLTPKFTITYTGKIYPGKQDPSPLFRAIAELRQEGKISAGEIEVRLFGSNVSATISPLVEKYQAQEFVGTYGFVPFKESVKKQKESTVLLLLSWNDPREKGVYTGKIFEYLGAMRPILAVGLKRSVIDELLTRTGSGIIATEVAEIKGILLNWLDEFRLHGNVLSHYAPKQEVIRQYTRREQTRQLAKLLDEVSTRKPR